MAEKAPRSHGVLLCAWLTPELHVVAEERKEKGNEGHGYKEVNKLNVM